MTDLEPIITAWILSPVGLIVTAVVVIAIVAISLGHIMNTFPRYPRT